MARPRSVRAHEEVLKAALTLIADRGIDVTSVDAIAEASGVSKATIYKHWPTKEALCLEAISSVSGGDLPEFDSGNPRADLTKMLQHLAQSRKPVTMGKLWPRIVGHAAGNPAFAGALRARFDAPRRTQLTRLIGEAIAQGQLRRDLDVDFAMDLLFGPIMHRRFSSTEVPPNLAKKVVDMFWKTHAPEPIRSAAGRSRKA